MRNDHIALRSGGEESAHRFLGTLNTTPTGGMLNACPSDRIKVLEPSKKPKTFCKQVRNADYIVLDISQFTADLGEADAVLEALKFLDSENVPEKPQTLIVVSSVMAWSNTARKPDGSPHTERDVHRRAPLPKFSHMKEIEKKALALPKHNDKLRVHVVCSGFLYGNGEQNDIFYEFFRRSWVSLHPELSALPVIAGGQNNLPTIHVADLASAIDAIFTNGAQYGPYLLAVDQSQSSTQRAIMTTISEGIGSGATKDLERGDVMHEPWCEFLTVDVKLQTSPCLLEAIEW
jgi:nucleoside-diphosphate-sugar epimerase